MTRALLPLGLLLLGACSGGEADVVGSADVAVAASSPAEDRQDPKPATQGTEPNTPDDSATKTPDVESNEESRPDSKSSVDVTVPPSYPLRFLKQAAEDPARWEARLIERAAEGHCTFWSWRVLELGTPDPRLTYASIEHPLRDDVEVFAEVRQRGGDWLARTQVPVARGVQVEPIDMKLLQVAVFGGGVVDGDGDPVMNAELRLYQVEGSRAPVFYSHPHLAWTNDAGEFRFGGVEPGNYWLRVVTEGRPPVVLQLQLEGGDSSSYELKMSTLESMGQLPIAVLGFHEGHLPSALLTLHSLDGQGVRRVAHPRKDDDALAQLMRAGVGYAGLFPRLPEGRYALSVLGLDSHPYEPATSQIEFDALGEGVRIQAQLTEESHPLRFLVRAAGSEEALRDCYLRFSSNTWWAPESLVLQPTEKEASFSPDMPTPQWMVGRAGYQPAFGTFEPDESNPDETLEEIELVPGWGCELLFRDGRARLPAPESDTWERTGAVHLAAPLEGVAVYADGEKVAQSDQTGRVRILLPAPPTSLRFEFGDWEELPHYLTGFVDAHDIRGIETVGSTVVWFDRRE